MPPGLIILMSEILRNVNKLPHRHFFQIIVVHDRPTPCRLAVEDVTASRLRLVFTVDAMTEVHTALGERRRYSLRGLGPAPWKYGDQMQGKVGRGELLQDLERIAAVPAATGFDACRAQLGIFFGEMGYTAQLLRV